MKCFKASSEEPEILLFDSVDEIRKELGFVGTHGVFDPNEFKIYATLQSLPHEIGHYKDFRSGRMRPPHLEGSVETKNLARLRNEMVATLYAWKKTADPTFLLPYEREFIEWVYFQIDRGHSLHTHELKDWSFSDIQDFVEHFIANKPTELKKLRTLFAHYLDRIPSQPELQAWVF
ncbi:MAG: hypothetical protein EA369_05805 [Bradymonadales bacterium]|nr:MAG: hypothetical protein EA369_05805 [Bradymonadales bacterium]